MEEINREMNRKINREIKVIDLGGVMAYDQAWHTNKSCFKKWWQKNIQVPFCW